MMLKGLGRLQTLAGIQVMA